MSKRDSLNSMRMKSDGNGEILIYDEIGYGWFDEGVTAKGFKQELKDLGAVKSIDVRINSPGGSVVHGLAIYNALKDHPADINIHIDGLAASMATVVAMAGDKIHMAENALFMIHEPSGIAFGTAEDMLATAALLETMSENAVNIYASRTGMNAAAVKAAMKAETWYSAAEAKAAGFVNEITPNKALSAAFDPVKFDKAPEWAKHRLAEMQAQKSKEVPAMTEPTKPVEQPAAPAVDTAAIVAKAKEEARAEERERQTRITALCQQAKRPEMAAKFCEDGAISVADVQAKLFEELCKANGPLGDDGGTSGDAPAKPDENEKYRQEFKAEPAYAKSMTEAEYIAMRRVDDGKEVLAVGKSETK